MFSAASSNGNRPLTLAGFDIVKPDLLFYLSEVELDTEIINVAQPVFDSFRCKYCGDCHSYCPEKAIQFSRYIPSVTLIVARCSACGKCMKVCNKKAISTKQKQAGTIYHGFLPGKYFTVGELGLDSEYKTTIVKALLKKTELDGIVFCDFGPGDDLHVHNGLAGMDFSIIVVTPEEDWEQNFEKMIALVKNQGTSAGVIVNKIQSSNNILNQVQFICIQHEIPLIGIVPLKEIYTNVNPIFYDWANSDDNLLFSEMCHKIYSIMNSSLQSVTKL